jgi:hypothetical protein
MRRRWGGDGRLRPGWGQGEGARGVKGALQARERRKRRQGGRQIGKEGREGVLGVRESGGRRRQAEGRGKGEAGKAWWRWR